MVVNRDWNEDPHVEFVEYTGKWPCLCHGSLTLKIDGKIYRFGNEEKYPRFWRSGGECYMGDIFQEEWEINYLELPEEIRKYADEIDSVFNTNVEQGCCGGCR